MAWNPKGEAAAVPKMGLKGFAAFGRDFGFFIAAFLTPNPLAKTGIFLALIAIGFFFKVTGFGTRVVFSFLTLSLAVAKPAPTGPYSSLVITKFDTLYLY